VAIKKGQSKETGNIGYKKQRKSNQKRNAKCVGHRYAKANTNNVNKTCTVLQPTGGKVELNLNFMRKSERTSQRGTQNVETHNRTTQKSKKMSKTTPPKNWG
jgi:hypothetical protein